MEPSPQPEHGKSQNVMRESSVLRVTLENNLHLGPCQTKSACVEVDDSQTTMSPRELTLAELGCDFIGKARSWVQ